MVCIYIVDAEIPDTPPAILLVSVIIETKVEPLVIRHLIVIPLMDVLPFISIHINIFFYREGCPVSGGVDP